MALKKIIYKIQRIYSIGWYKTLAVIKHKLIQRFFILKYTYFMPYKNKKKSFISWKLFCKKYTIVSPDAYKDILNLDMCENIFNHNLFQQRLPKKFIDRGQSLSLADSICQGKISILNNTYSFDVANIPWHQDISYRHQSPHEWKTFFYKKIIFSSDIKEAQQQPDIKVPWELSRLQFLSVVGLAYKKILVSKEHQDRKTIYEKFFVDSLTSWIDANPFLYGVNWTNPMEVAIRAINMLWAIYFFKDSDAITPDLWKIIICVLHDHAIFINNNLEFSDRPNNHYLADLIGYNYIVTGFEKLPLWHKKITHSFAKTDDAFLQQLLLDGCSYEGSTSYHGLVTELMLHHMLLHDYHQKNTTTMLVKKMKDMLQAFDDFNDPEAILIGDNDSGKIVFGIEPEKTWSNTIIKKYENFGLTIIKKNVFFLTFRHPVWQKNQPTGHFHQDYLSFTLYSNDKPFFIDPGMYAYTSYPKIRKYLQGFDAHNTFFIDDDRKSKITIQNNLFYVPQVIHNYNSIIQSKSDIISIHDQHCYYKENNLIAHRKITIDSQQVILADWWEGIQNDNQYKKNIIRTYWSFHLHPNVIAFAHNNEKTYWTVVNDNEWLEFQSPIPLELCRDLYAPDYHILKQSKTLRCSQIMTIGDKKKWLITRIKKKTNQ